jgi:anti-anti-sigma factor
MDAGGFTITVEHDDAVARLRLAGELDLARVGQLAEAVTAARASAATLEIDLTRLVFIDSSGLRALMAIHNTAESDGFAYTMIEGPPSVHRTFVLTGLDQVFNFAAT